MAKTVHSTVYLFVLHFLLEINQKSVQNDRNKIERDGFLHA